MPNLNLKNLPFDQILNNLNLNRYVQEAYFRHEYTPGAFTGGGSFTQGQSTLEMSTILMLDSGAQNILYTFPRPKLWTNGYISGSQFVVFTAVGGGGTKEYIFDVFGHTVGSSYAAGTKLVTKTFQHINPTANQLEEDTYEETSNLITTAYDTLSIVIRHDGGAVKDTSPANLRVGCGYIEYHPKDSQ